MLHDDATMGKGGGENGMKSIHNIEWANACHDIILENGTLGQSTLLDVNRSTLGIDIECLVNQVLGAQELHDSLP